MVNRVTTVADVGAATASQGCSASPEVPWVLFSSPPPVLSAPGDHECYELMLGTHEFLKHGGLTKGETGGMTIQFINHVVNNG